MTDIEHFKAVYGLWNQEVLILPYGSRVYGTASEKSDYDFIAVIPENRMANTGEEYRHNVTNITMYNRRDWQDQLNKHKIHTLETYFLPDGICKANFKFQLNLQTLRHELSEKSSHSFVKAKKKIDVEKDYYIGWKSLFHSLRILNFGIQIATKGKIEDYSAANSFWWDIINDPHYEWGFYQDKYKPIYNKLCTEFRKVAPKEVGYGN